MIDHSIDDDPVMDAARHIGAATRLVTTGLMGLERERQGRTAEQRREEAAREEAKRATIEARTAARQRDRSRGRDRQLER